MTEEIIINMFNTNELNRLHRCAKDNNKEKLREWGIDYDRRLKEQYNKIYLERHIERFTQSIKDLDIATIFTLHFNENLHLNEEEIIDFMNDVRATERGFYKDGYTRQDYIKMLEDDGINMERWK